MGTSTGEERGSPGDIVDLLRARNGQIRDAFQAVAAAEGPVGAALVDQLVTHLAVHHAVTQELVRPLVERHRPAEGAEGVEPHEGTEVMGRISRLADMGVADNDFVAQLLGVARIVTLHIEAQERVDLALLRRAVPEAELRALADPLISAETAAWAGARAIQAEVPCPDPLGLADVLAALAAMVRRPRQRVSRGRVPHGRRQPEPSPSQGLGAAYADQRRTRTADPTPSATAVAAAAHPRRRHGISVLAA